MKYVHVIGHRIVNAIRMPLLYRNWFTAYSNRFRRQTDSRDTVLYKLRGRGNMLMNVGPQDVRILNEVFIDQEYAHPQFTPINGWRLIDVGAHKGTFAKWVWCQAPLAETISFEPHPENYRLCSKNVSSPVINAAIGAKRGSLQLFEVVGSTGQSSLSRSRAEARGAVARWFDVEVLTLADALDQVGGHADAIKIDIEGSEYSLVMETPREVWRNIDRIAMEYDAVDSDGTLIEDQILARLSELGYIVDVPRAGFLFAWLPAMAG